jgi:hypothetical protein
MVSLSRSFLYLMSHSQEDKRAEAIRALCIGLWFIPSPIPTFWFESDLESPDLSHRLVVRRFWYLQE